jgi:O-acetylhomoserine/O-acetylserine sulfhydrylase-like pyridoxal-dependent enzyme
LSETGVEQVAVPSGEVRDIKDIERFANHQEVKPFCDATIPADTEVVSQKRVSKLEVGGQNNRGN